MAGIAACEPMDKFEVMEYAVLYSSDGDLLQAQGPYEYENTSYYIVQFFNETEKYGELVLDGFTGEVIRDEQICERVFYAESVIDSAGFEITSGYYHFFTFEDLKKMSNDGYEFYTALADYDHLASSDVDKIKTGAYIYMDLELQYENIIKQNENGSNIRIIDIDGSVKDVDIFIQQRTEYYKKEQLLNDILIRANNEMPFVNDIVGKNYGSGYDYTINNLDFYKDDLKRSTESLENWGSIQSDVQNKVDNHFLLMNSLLEANSKKVNDNEVENNSFPIPGFGALYSLIGFFVLMAFNRKN
jgi:hypothetical protein